INEKELDFSVFSNSRYHIRSFKEGNCEIEDLVTGNIMPFPPGLIDKDVSFEFSEDDKYLLLHSWSRADFEYYKDEGDYGEPDSIAMFHMPSGHLVDPPDSTYDFSNSETFNEWNNRSALCDSIVFGELLAKAEQNILIITNKNDKNV